MWRRVGRVKQHDATDCGAACLRSVAAFHGRRIPLAMLRRLAGTGRQGTTVLGVVEAATRIGFEAKGVRTSLESLSKLPLPVIAHVTLPSGLQHYVVVSRVRRRTVTVMDPADGYTSRISRDQFRARWSGVLVLLAPSAGSDSTIADGNVISRFRELVRPHRTVMLQALVGASVYTVLGLSTAVYVQKIVDHVLVGGDLRLLNLLGLLMLAILALQIYVGWVKSVLTLRTGQKIDAALVIGYYRHLLKLPQTFFDTMRIGEIIVRVNDAVKIRSFINDVAIDLAVNLMVVTFSIGLMFLYSWPLALLVASLLPLYALVYHLSDRVNRRELRRLMECGAELESQLVESIGAIATVRRFGLHEDANLKTETRFVRLLRAVYATASAGIFSTSGSELISRLGVVGVLWAGAHYVISGELTPGELMSVYALLGYLTAPAGRLISANATIRDALIAGDRLFEIMDLEQERDSAPSVSLPPRAPYDVRFEQVTFGYGGRTPMFAKLSLTMEAARLTAIVGGTGSGKSTIVALLQRLYPIQEGRILIGGHDLRFADADDLRARVAAVPQEVHLFAGNVFENVAPGDPQPNMMRLTDVCDRLGVTDFAERLPQGFLTPLGENGVGLSGGQRQRLAIARALYRDPEVLVLDEATSHLDSLSERYVRQVVADLREAGKTVILIAHRLTSVVDADAILVLNGGRLVESGTHRELVSGDGYYAELWHTQHAHRGSPVVPRYAPAGS
ncbi:MAG: peptidase domain-containing ABC transporter [Gemmatimonadota bacterium]